MRAGIGAVLTGPLLYVCGTKDPEQHLDGASAAFRFGGTNSIQTDDFLAAATIQKNDTTARAKGESADPRISDPWAPWLSIMRRTGRPG